MRAVLQRVLEASVVVDGRVVGSIGPGCLALIGLCEGDDLATGVKLLNKVLSVRLWPADAVEGAAGGSGAAHDSRPWSSSLTTTKLSLLMVSQFTLHASCKKPKPDFHRAMSTDRARELFSQLVEQARRLHGADRVATGAFGAMMQVRLVNDGPVTIVLDTDDWVSGGLGGKGGASGGAGDEEEVATGTAAMR